MTKNEKLRNLIAKDVFSVANMLTHYDIEVSEDLEIFMMEWFEQDPYTPTDYTFNELKAFAAEILALVNENPDVKNEPMVKFPLSTIKELNSKTEEEMLIIKESNIEYWKDMDDISSVGGISGFISKHGNNEEFLQAQALINAMLG